MLIQDPGVGGGLIGDGVTTGTAQWPEELLFAEDRVLEYN